jgi:signal transduction histidine kinase
MTAVVLQKEVGTEGGFYLQTADRLLGYAFPTHEGPGIKKDMPQKEVPTILELVRRAAATKQTQSVVFRGELDDIVFQAAPIVLDNGDVAGSTWMMKRLPGLHSKQSFRTYAGVLILAFAAIICVLLAFVIARNLQSGISDIEARLLQLERDLATPSEQGNRLTEIRRIVSGVDRLAAALRMKITQERDLEEKLRHSERLAALGRVAAGVAHELRNPLATIRLRTQLSARNPQAESVQRNSSVILDEITRLDRMAERLLLFARPLKLTVQAFDLSEILRSAVESRSSVADKQHVSIKLETGNHPLMTMADPSTMRQVVDNLVSNAIDSIEGAGGEVVIKARHTTDGSTHLEVRDTGAGISSEDLAHVFDPFFTTKQNGTGLGLSICYEIVKAHDGEIEVRSNVGEGTIVSIVLPQTRQPMAEPQHDSNARLGG